MTAAWLIAIAGSMLIGGGLGWLLLRALGPSTLPTRTLVAAVAVGGAVTVPFAFLPSTLLPLDPLSLAFDGLWLKTGLSFVALGTLEEAAKLFAAWVTALRRRGRSMGGDALIAAAMAAIGFAAVESVAFSLPPLIAGDHGSAAFADGLQLLCVRAVFPGISHIGWAMIWGLGLARQRGIAFVGALLAAAGVAHGASNILLAAGWAASYHVLFGLLCVFITWVTWTSRRASSSRGHAQPTDAE